MFRCLRSFEAGCWLCLCSGLKNCEKLLAEQILTVLKPRKRKGCGSQVSPIDTCKVNS